MSVPDATPSVPAGQKGRSPSVRFRVVVYAVVMVALMLGITWAATVSAEQQAHLATRLTSRVGPSIDANLRIRASLTEAEAAVKRHDLNGTQVALAAAQAGVSDLDGLISSQVFGDDSTPAVAKTRGLAQTQKARLDEYTAWIVDTGVADPNAMAATEQLHEQVLEANQDVADSLSADRAALRVATREGGERTGEIVLLATGIALFLAALATWWTLHSLTKPILDLRDVVRRQRAGDREWARVDRGASEVRQLAADVNALTASHLQLLDEQALRLVMERAERDLARTLGQAVDTENALFLTAEHVAENLRAGHVIAVMRGHCGDVVHIQHWIADEHSNCVPQADGEIRTVIGRGVDLAHDFVDGLMRIDDVNSPEGREVLTRLLGPGKLEDITGSLLIAAIGPEDRWMGSLILHEDAPGRVWRDAETSFFMGAADVVASFVVAQEIEEGRADYVRQLEELDRQKDNFLSTVSHELRTPLASIIGYVELLQDGDAGELTKAQSSMIDVIERNTLRLRGLIEDILVLNRIQDGSRKSTHELVDMADVVEATVEEFRAAADKQGVTVKSTTAPGAVVLGDRAHLTRAVANVVANAVKFTPPGGDIDLIAAVDAQTRVVRVLCTDTGMGIPAGESPRISERFFRASNAATAQIPGTGLGLAIVRGIIESHGGRLSLTSTENAGTTVTMALPGPPVESS